MFISSCAGSYSGSALANYVFGIRAWHILHGIPGTMDDMQVKATLEGASALTPPSSKRPKRAPFTISLPESLFSKLDPKDPLDAAVRSCLAVSFFALARCGEFTVSSIDAFDPSIHIKCSDVHEEWDQNDFLVPAFWLPWTKCVRTGEDVYCAIVMDR